MQFFPPLQPATLIRRYKRFLADVELSDGSREVAHCPNTGSMRSCGAAGDKVWLSTSEKSSRKLRYTWEMTQFASGDLVVVNTHRANGLVAEVLPLSGLLPQRAQWQREVKCGRSRIDFCGRCPEGRRLWLEVKTVTLYESEILWFPDAVTTRGQRHLGELAEVVARGERAAMVYVLLRGQTAPFRLANHIDSGYAAAAQEAAAAGVEFYTAPAKISPFEVRLEALCRVTLSPPSG